jgi:hypothetical protein
VSASVRDDASFARRVADSAIWARRRQCDRLVGVIAHLLCQALEAQAGRLDVGGLDGRVQRELVALQHHSLRHGS